LKYAILFPGCTHHIQALSSWHNPDTSGKLKDTKLGSPQTSKIIIEQLEKKIAEALSIEEQIDAMNGLAWQLRIQDPKRALVLSSEALKLSRSIGYESAIPTSLINLAFDQYGHDIGEIYVPVVLGSVCLYSEQE
jgi:hypothetical protein